jgi:hypothetical protein
MTDTFRALCQELLADYDNCHYRSELSDRARAALAQPEPQGPTDEELLRIYRVATPCYQVEEYKRELDLARAVLARWGTPTAQPVPVSERLPGPEDCDAKGRCWWWDEDDDDMWLLSEHRPWILCWTHWLPRWALPVPKREAEQ